MFSKKILFMFLFIFCGCLVGCKEKPIDEKYLKTSVEELYLGDKNQSFAQLQVISISDNIYNDENKARYIKLECKIIEDFYDRIHKNKTIYLLVNMDEYKSFSKAKDFFLNQECIFAYFKSLGIKYKLYDEKTSEELKGNSLYIVDLEGIVSIIPIKDGKVDFSEIKKVRKDQSAFPYKEFMNNKMTLEEAKNNITELASTARPKANRNILSFYSNFNDSYLSLIKITSISDKVYQNDMGDKYALANCEIVEDFFEKMNNGSNFQLLIDLSNFKDFESAKSFVLEQEYILSYFVKVPSKDGKGNNIVYETKTKDGVNGDYIYYTFLENFLSIIPIKDDKVDLKSIGSVSVYSRDVSEYGKFSDYITNGMFIKELKKNLRLLVTKVETNDTTPMVPLSSAYNNEATKSLAQLKVLEVAQGDEKEYIRLKCEVVEDLFNKIKNSETIYVLIKLDEFKDFNETKDFFLKQEYIISYIEQDSENIYKTIYDVCSSIIFINDGKVDLYPIKEIKKDSKSFPYKKDIYDEMTLNEAKSLLIKLLINSK